MKLEAAVQDPVCNRCGRCCYYQDAAGSWRKCKYLVQHGSRSSSCRIWGRNFGVEIAPGVICAPVDGQKRSWRGCPYNPGQPIQEIPIAPFHDGSDPGSQI